MRMLLSLQRSSRLLSTRVNMREMKTGAKRERSEFEAASHNSGVVTRGVQGMVMTDHFFEVPLDHSGQEEGTIEIYARVVIASSKTQQPSGSYLLYLQGGPGFASPRPTESLAWVKEACKNFTLVLLDQRGTGRSSPIRTSVLQALGPPAEQLRYLRHFRADSIVRDAELVRRELVPAESNGGSWSVLGQSFGGFCSFSYLSLAPAGVLEAFVAGGIPPNISLPCPARLVYEHTFQRVIAQNKKYYALFPDDVAVVRNIVNFLAAQPQGGVQTPSGTWIRPRTLQLLGFSGLGAGGGFENLHYMLESALDTSRGTAELTPAFIKAFETAMPWDTNPLYALLHEACYTQGPATAWAAHAVREARFREIFDAEATAAAPGGVVFFTGEMVFPWMFDDFASLRPLKAIADAVAAADGWSRLYDADALARNNVPIASATYVEDMYVDFELAQKTAQQVQGLRQWMTNEFLHSGLRDDGARIFDRLLGMNRGTILHV